MKKNILTVILLVLLIITYSYRKRIISNDNKEIIVNSNEIVELEKEPVILKIYDSLSNKIIEKEVEVKNREFLTMYDYINLIVKNSTHLTNSMNLLAVYELDNNSILIILSNDFKKLSKTSYIGTITSIKATLKEIFENIEEINIKLEGNI